MELIAKIWRRKSNGQKFITIPKNCELTEGTYVRIKSMTETK
ncbi:unnamed protein product [marine sediment metagenome]|uniref:Uncharacterized protein n=1 Tax=marine sediment metagenome TaxID=412755 RepID=X1D4W7_9ZZZZ